MNNFTLLFLCIIYASTVIGSNDTKAEDEKVQCPCPHEFHDECILREYCVYGINDEGHVYFNGKNDGIDLTNVAVTRKKEIIKFLDGHEDDDVLVNLYSPQRIAQVIFYYGCRKCDDLKQLGSNITVSKLKVFLLSLYNQRMKLNLKYSQSDFQYYSDPSDDVQLMPEISVRPFWKNRLMFNESCANKLQEFTQKHYIPAFLTQDLCILNYKYFQLLNVSTGKYNEYQTNHGEITYSLTLSNMGFYAYNIIVNSTSDLPIEFQNVTDRCLASFYMDSYKRSVQYFCLCDNPSCTLKVTSRNPLNICPDLKFPFNTSETYSEVGRTTYFATIDQFFFQNGDNGWYCLFAWRLYGTVYDLYIRKFKSVSPLGYQTDSTLSRKKGFCPFENVSVINIEPLRTRYYNNNPLGLRSVFLNVTTDHIKIEDARSSPFGANCTSEGTLSDPFFSSALNSNTSSFPCYQYLDLTSFGRVFPMVGINLMPISVIKGKECYYYTVKVDQRHGSACNSLSSFPVVMTIAACPDNILFDDDEIGRVRNLSMACPTMKPGESKWRYETGPSRLKSTLCGQFLRGLKIQNGIFVPAEIELRQIDTSDLLMVGMKNENQSVNIEHGCGFNASQQLTLCTCYAALGGCDNLYTAGRAHLFRFLPFLN